MSEATNSMPLPMTSGSKDDADTVSSDVTKPAVEETHTGQGAPTEDAHLDANDGSLTARRRLV